jgi:hypothetical protein
MMEEGLMEGSDITTLASKGLEVMPRSPTLNGHLMQ